MRRTALRSCEGTGYRETAAAIVICQAWHRSFQYRPLPCALLEASHACIMQAAHHRICIATPQPQPQQQPTRSAARTSF
jgi:hypothetical protein